MTTNRLVLLLLIPILQMRLTAGKGVIDIHFLSYSDDCDEAAGLGTCDPMFTFCVTRPDFPTSIHRSECYYKPTSESGHYHDTNYINLAPITNIEGLANPWVFEADLKESSVKLVWRVQDSDLIGSDHMVSASILLTEPVWPNVGVAKYQNRKSQKSDHILRFEIRVYCTANTYGSLCDVYCPPPSVTDRYYCDPDTGDRKCLEGWEGEDCDVNVDECSQGRCVHGECTDNVGSYTCENCDQGYSGQDCSIPDDPCQVKPCQNRGTCLPSPNTTTQYKCECDYPYTGPLCDDVITTTTITTTTTEPTANTASTTTPVLSPSGPSSSSPTSTVTNRTNTGGSTKGPVAKASKAESAGFDTWIILVIALCLVFAIGSVIICFVCRRKKIIQRRKESRVPLSNVTYDGDTMAFDNNAYNHMQNGNVAGSGSIRESLPPPPAAPPITTQLAPPLSFHPDKGAWSEREEMDDDGYLKANDVPAFLRDVTDGLTASGRRAQSNLYSNFQGLSQKEPTSPPNPDYADEEHYHDLDETVMTLRNNNVSNGGDLRPLSAEEEEEGAYSGVPRNTPSYKTKVPQRNNYDLVRVRPDSRDLPKLPTTPADTQPETPRSEPQSSKATTRNTHYPPLANEPLRRTDPFASHVADDDYQTCDVDLPTRDFGAEYETPRNSQKGGRFAGEGEGGYELVNSGGFHGENSKPTGGYEVPDISPYVTPSTGSDKTLTPVSKAYDHLKPSIFHRSAAAPPPTYNNLGSVTAQAGETGNGKEEKEEADVDGDYLLSFPPPPPPIDPDDLETLDDDLDSVNVTGPRPLSFHTGQTEKEIEEEEESDEKTAKKKKNYLANGVFLNPLFGGVGPSDPTHSTTTDEAGGEEVVDRSRPSRSGSSTLGIGSRPLSFHHGQTEIERGDDEDDNDDDGGDENGDVKRLKKGLANTGFVNPTFESDGPRDVTESGDSNKSRDDADVSGDVIIKNDDDASSQVDKPPPSPPPPTAPKPGKAPPLYMENFGFDEMDL